MMRLKTFIRPRGNVSGFICFLCFKFYVCLSSLRWIFSILIPKSVIDPNLGTFSSPSPLLYFSFLIFGTSHSALENTITFSGLVNKHSEYLFNVQFNEVREELF